MTHCLEVKQRWSQMRLIPTTIIGVLSLIHFHLVVWWFPSLYPLPNIVPNFVESFLLFVTCVTGALSALTQLLMTGSITKPLVGHAALMPKWHEDFSVVLFRLGTASLEATSVAGLGNEVGTVVQSPGDIARAPLQPDDSTVEIARTGVVAIVPGKHARPHQGFANEIKNVRVAARHSEAWLDALVNATWFRELGRFLLGMWKVLRGAARAVWAKLRNRGVSAPSPDSGEPQGEVLSRGAHAEREIDSEFYARFLRGDDLSEDEEDFAPDESAPGTPSSASDDDGDDGDDDTQSEADDGTSDALVLYANLSETASSPATASLLLAHMSNPSSSPLTRRRYSSFVSNARGQPSSAASQIVDWNAFVQERRDAKRDLAEDEGTLESRRQCVICIVEPRDIICWPCR